MKPRIEIKTGHKVLAVIIISFAILLGIVQCGGGGGGGGSSPERSITVSGKVDDGTANSPIVYARCRFEDLDGTIHASATANANGEYNIAIPPDVEGNIICRPSNLAKLNLSTFFSTEGMSVGTRVAGEDITPITTVVAQIIDSENPFDSMARKDELITSIATQSDPYLNLLAELSTKLYARMYQRQINVNFADGSGESADSDSDDGGGAEGSAGDGGDFSPIPNATCEFVVGRDLGEGRCVLYNAALADFCNDGELTRPDLEAIRDIINAEFAGETDDIAQAFATYFPQGFGLPYRVTADENGDYFLPIPPNVSGYVRCTPPDKEKLALATYVPKRQTDEILAGQDVNPATTFFSHHIASQLSGDLSAAKDNYLADIAGMGDIRILMDDGTVTGFELQEGNEPADKDTGVAAFSATSLFNVLYKNGTDADFLTLLDDFVENRTVAQESLTQAGVSQAQAQAFSAIANTSNETTAAELGTSLDAALSKAEINVTVTESTGGALVQTGIVEIYAADDDIICENCISGNQLDNIDGMARFSLSGVPSTATDISILVHSVPGYPETSATTQVVSSASVDLEISLSAPQSGTLSFSAATYSVNEYGDSVTITVARTGGSDGAVGVSYSTSDGTATAGSDYTATSGTLSWADGDSAARTFSIPITDDSVLESSETVNLTLSSASGGATLGSPSTAVLTIVDNEASQPGELSFSAATYSVNENGGSVAITVTRTGGSDGAVGISYATSNGTATAGSDYTATGGTLSWADGDSANKTFSIPILDDSVLESSETVNLTLSSASGGATLGSPSTAVLTIVDNESPQPGTLSFSAATYSVGEDVSSVSITVSRAGGSDGAVDVSYATSDGTATAGSDYTATSGTLSWADGDSADKTFSIPILDDSVLESNETVNLTLSSATGGATLGSPITAVLTVLDDEVPQPGVLNFSAATYSVNENGGSVTITVTRTGGSDGAVGVSYATSDGTATAGSDYTTTSGTLSWTDGDSADKTFSIPIIDDSTYEGNETVDLTLSSPTGDATLGSPSIAVLTIVDNESPQPGTLSFSAATYSVGEDVSSVTITVTRTGGSDGAVGVSYATSNGSATAGSDYTATSGALSWMNGDSANKTFSIPILDDSVYEGNETVNLTLESATGGATLGSQSTAVLTVFDDEVPQPGVLSFSIGTYDVDENGTSQTITVTRTGGSDGTVGVSYTTSNGTATAGLDYTTTSGTLSWADGDSANKTFSIPILDDSTYEGDETVNLTLYSATGGATLGSPYTAVLTIVDNESPQPGVFSFSAASYSVSENGGSVTITVRRTGGSDGAVGVSYATSNGSATAGSDYTPRSGTLSWTNGDSANKTFSIPILDDSTYEGNETVNLTLSFPTGGATLGSPSTAVLTIVDYEPGVLSFSASTYSVSENGGSVTITVRRSGGSSGAVGVSYATSNGSATAGSDYTPRSGTLSWTNGDSANKTFSISILDDTTYEGNETVNLTLSSPTGGATLGSPSTAVLTIVDYEPGVLSFSASTYSVSENGGSVTITVRRTGGSDGAVGVSYATSNGSATAGSDYTPRSGTLSWTNGDSANKTFSIPILDDSTYEGNETVNLTLSFPTGGATLGSPSTAVLTIVDYEPGVLSFSASTYSVSENGGSVTITVRRSGGSSGAVGVSYATSNGSATAGSDYTPRSGTLSWTNGDSANKTFSISILDDTTYEGNETVNLTLYSPSGGATLGSPYTAVLTIVENDTFGFTFNSNNQGWRRAGFYDGGGLSQIQGYFVETSVGWTNGIIYIGSSSLTLPASPSGDNWIHWDFNSPDLRNDDSWNAATSFSYRISGEDMTGYTGDSIYVQAVLHVLRPDLTESYFTDGGFHPISLGTPGWATHTVNIAGLGMPAGTRIININLRVFFRPSSFIGGHIMLDNVIAQ